MTFDRSVFSKLATPSVALTLTQGDVSVDLQLCFDMNAAALVKQKLGKSIFSQADLKSLDPSDWPTIVWAGLQRYQGTVSLQDVGSVMNLANWQYIVGKCMEAFTVGMPKGTADPKTEPTTEPVPVQA
jgi:hypothetical protein